MRKKITFVLVLAACNWSAFAQAVSGLPAIGPVNASTSTFGSAPTTDVSVNVTAVIASITPVPSGAYHGHVTLDSTKGVYNQQHTIYIPSGTDYDCDQTTMNWVGPGSSFGTGVGYQVVLGSAPTSPQDNFLKFENCFLENNGANAYTGYPGGILFGVTSGADNGANNGWHPRTVYATNSLISVLIASKWYQLKATAPGTSGASSPSFKASGTTVDGSVIWTSQGLQTTRDRPLIQRSTTYTPITGYLFTELGDDGNYYYANMAQTSAYSSPMQSGICVTSSSAPTFPLTLGAGVVDGTCYVVNEGLEQPFNTADAGGYQETIQNVSEAGAYQAFSGGGNFFINDYLNDKAIHNFNGLADALCFGNSGEQFRWIGGNIDASMSNGVVLNCSNHLWQMLTSVDYSNEWGAPGVSAAANIAGNNISLSNSTIWLEHNAGPEIASTSGPIQVTLTGSEMVEDQKGLRFPLTSCSVASNVATCAMPLQNAPLPVVGTNVYITGASGTGCSSFKGLLVLASIKGGGTGFTAMGAPAGTFSCTGGYAQDHALSITADAVTRSGSTYTATFTVTSNGSFPKGYEFQPYGLAACTALNGQIVTVNAATNNTFSADVSAVSGIGTCSGSETGAAAVAATEGGYIALDASTGDGGDLSGIALMSFHPVTKVVNDATDLSEQFSIHGTTFISYPPPLVNSFYLASLPSTNTTVRPVFFVYTQGHAPYAWNSQGVDFGGLHPRGYTGAFAQEVVGDETNSYWDPRGFHGASLSALTPAWGAFTLGTSSAPNVITRNETDSVPVARFWDQSSSSAGDLLQVENGSLAVGGITNALQLYVANGRFSSLPSAPLLGTTGTGLLQQITLGTGLSMSGTTLNANMTPGPVNGSSTSLIHNDYWSIQPTLFATGTLLGPAYYEVNAGTIRGITARLAGKISCTVAPTIAIVDLGTSVTTAYASGTVLESLATGKSDGAFSTTGLSVAITAGHYLGLGFSAGTCVTAPQVDATIAVQ